MYLYLSQIAFLVVAVVGAAWLAAAGRVRRDVVELRVPPMCPSCGLEVGRSCGCTR